MLNQKSTECPQKNPHRQTIITVATCSFTDYSFLLPPSCGTLFPRAISILQGNYEFDIEISKLLYLIQLFFKKRNIIGCK